jgi:pilus assembly protein CpaE
MTTLSSTAPESEALDLERGRFGDRVLHYDGLVGGCVDAAAFIAGRAPEVVVLGAGLLLPDALSIAEQLDRTHPEIGMILVAKPGKDLWQRALEVGVRAVVSPHDHADVLDRAVLRELYRSERRRENRVATDTTGRTGARVITVLSPKGGVGKTTVATNLAAGLATLHPQQVCIVDLDLQFGDVADAFLLSPPHSLADVPAGTVDASAVKLLLAATDGLYALCAPDDPAAGEDVPGETVATAIEALARDLSFVVIDTGAGIDANTLTAVERSTDLVFVGSLDVPSVRSVKKLITALDRLGLTEAERHVVLNRADSRVGVRADEVVATLGLPIAVEIPSSRMIPSSLNTGAPIVLSEARSAAAFAFQQLVALFTDIPTDVAPRRWRFLTRSAS